MSAAAMPEYLWLVVAGAFAAFGYGWATGANDVANAFGTSVGSKSITLRQATVLAAIFEFGGAMLLGRVVTNTIAGGIADPRMFARTPEVYAWGMVCALFVAFVWQGWASSKGYNVSATHSIIGSIIGFALAFGGTGAVQWARPDPRSFPPYRGIVPIVLSWVVSPILTGAVAAAVFGVTRWLVLRRERAAKLAFWVLPPAVLITVMINVFFVFTRGALRSLGDEWSVDKAAWVSALIAAGTAGFTAVVILPLIKWRMAKQDAEVAEKAKDAEAQGDLAVEVATHSDLGPAKDGAEPPSSNPFKRLFRTASRAALYGTSVDVHQVVVEDEYIAALHARAEKFDPQAERTFGYLQVFSAICVIFAHGAGEVGQMAGPLAAIYDIYRNGSLSSSLSPDIWCVLVGAFALVVGLATYGYHVTRTTGVMLAKLSPSRGFAAELATALVIMVASQLGLPTSSSQCITGGIVGVGMMDGWKSGVNWKLFGKQFISWVATLFICVLGTAALFAIGIYTPSKIDGGHVIAYENGLSNTTGTLLKGFNESLLSFEDASSAGVLANLNPAQWQELNETVASIAGDNRDVTATRGNTAIQPSFVMDTLAQAMGLFQNNSVFTLGQNSVFPGANLCNNNITADITARINATCIAPMLTK
ncbi:hypothetical protein OEZ85_012894 [Tetradesmus obliquus]|uniref:Phosphate transporter n=1 Tax=Tetradesmus obliquus TaxID=3088 RepID=A0ABY8U494_TETOB|nr:hypothetical protein OEZ85_012894 [Tetradesmus obliquus]